MALSRLFVATAGLLQSGAFTNLSVKVVGGAPSLYTHGPRVGSTTIDTVFMAPHLT
jgi:hypothetical protein